ncbi:Gpi10p [Sugiyamaella lignohabitans]|uniref:Mannosyltransferase n=1 Tax=Sugiyamaella lignohabitans TaxID=796027 RepID=A0A161HI00_9ASCO|nr:Gpi10p [Sugiyamaella lignohabitans]ANB11947.1 Gpi10p [Sugiyamaella lignohabitans]
MQYSSRRWIHLPLYAIPLLVAFRVFNALSIKTFFQPDEYWQSLEPAHIAVYGYGYLTWEWREHLRSAAHPLLFAGVYKLANWLDIDPVLGPKLFQGVVAAIGDIYTYELAIQATNTPSASVAKLALFANLASAFNWFCLPRTFSNSLETVLTTIALSYWPWKSFTSGSPIIWPRFVLSLAIASIACIFRPTNALLWLFLGIHFLWTSSSSRQTTVKIIAATSAVLTLSLCFNGLVDYVYFGEPVFPLLNFIKFNIVESLSQFYGVNQWHYYLSQGLPLLTMAYLPLVLTGLYQYKSTIIVQLILFIIGSYSLLAHKEVRFIFPLIPLLHLLVAAALDRIRRRAIFPLPYLVAILLAINVPVATYFSLYHQRGVIDVISYLRHEPTVSSVGFLMPCHSTPWQSHIHRPDITAWFLTCEPPLGLTAKQQKSYLDIADQFYADPTTFLDTHFPPLDDAPTDTPPSHSDYDWPSHLVFFAALEPLASRYLSPVYQEVSSFFPGAGASGGWGSAPDPAAPLAALESFSSTVLAISCEAGATGSGAEPQPPEAPWPPDTV